MVPSDRTMKEEKTSDNGRNVLFHLLNQMRRGPFTLRTITIMITILASTPMDNKVLYLLSMDLLKMDFDWLFISWRKKY